MVAQDVEQWIAAVDGQEGLLAEGCWISWLMGQWVQQLGDRPGWPLLQLESQ